MSVPRSALQDVANKILSVVNEMERNTTTQPPSQTSLLMQTQCKYHTQRKYRKHQGQYRKFKRKYRKHQGRYHHLIQLASSTGFSSRTEKILLPRENRVKEEGNLHRCVKLLLLFFVLTEETQKMYQAKKKR